MNRPAEETPRPALALTRALQALALALGASTLVTAVHDVSTTWDVWYYHLPFAARLWGIVPESAFAFHPTNQARFEGFPLLAERLQGLFWWITGKPEAANLVCLASLALFVAFLNTGEVLPHADRGAGETRAEGATPQPATQPQPAARPWR